MIGLLAARSTSAISASAAIAPSFTSTRKMMTSAWAMAASTCCLTFCSNDVDGSACHPPVSTTANSRPCQETNAKTRSLVVPGKSATTDIRLPARRLSKVDLPTLVLPTIATIGPVTCLIPWDVTTASPAMPFAGEACFLPGQIPLTGGRLATRRRSPRHGGPARDA